MRGVVCFDVFGVACRHSILVFEAARGGKQIFCGSYFRFPANMRNKNISFELRKKLIV